MIDLSTEHILTFAQVAKRLPVSPKTVADWALYGVRGVKLASIKIGWRRVTSEQALQRFAEALTEGPSARTTVQQRRAHEKAVKDLQRRGVM